MSKKSAEKQSAELIKALQEDAALRAGVIRLLARDYPKDFLSPVRLEGTLKGTQFKGTIVSNKEWQE